MGCLCCKIKVLGDLAAAIQGPGVTLCVWCVHACPVVVLCSCVSACASSACCAGAAPGGAAGPRRPRAPMAKPVRPLLIT